MRRIGLVGCVKEKAAVRRKAGELYTSTLYVRRRCYVLRTCSEWWILSAKHGLLHPEAEIEPYDVALKDASAAVRRDWSRRVLEAVGREIRPRPGDVFEIHAGAEYRRYGLVTGGRLLGCEVVNPTEGLRLGQQLQFYERAGCR